MENNFTQLINYTERAIKDSGKTFSELSQKSILKFLKDNGVTDSETRDNVYKHLYNLHMHVPQHPTVEVEKEKSPVKQPRKNIFGEIKRVS